MTSDPAPFLLRCPGLATACARPLAMHRCARGGRRAPLQNRRPRVPRRRGGCGRRLQSRIARGLTGVLPGALPPATGSHPRPASPPERSPAASGAWRPRSRRRPRPRASARRTAVRSGAQQLVKIRGVDAAVDERLLREQPREKGRSFGSPRLDTRTGRGACARWRGADPRPTRRASK